MLRYFAFSLIALSLLLSPIFPSAISHAQPETASLIAFSAFRNGQWDVFTLRPDGSDLRNLTNDPHADSDPVFSPDGTQLVYSSRRGQNWDLYQLDLTDGTETRLTSNRHFDGAPAFSPDGTQLAFESFRGGDLDVWLLDLSAPLDDPQRLINLTGASPAGEFAPAWSLDGRWVAFSSWQAGTNDIWLIDPSDDTTDSLHQLTNTPTADLYPAWHPQGDAVVFTRDTLGHRDVEALFEVVAGLSDPDSRPPSEELSWLGSLSYPRFSPDGETLAAVLRTHYGHRLVTLNLAEHAQPTYLTEVHLLRGSIDWHLTAIVSGEALLSLATDDASSLYEEVVRPSISPNGEPHDLYRLNEVSTGSPWLSDLVDDSYRVMQRQLAAEVGYDFLGELSDMWRPMNFYSETSQYTSWHKSGRAFDTLFDWAGDAMKIVQEDVGGETYWRIFLRCSDQSGACGEPLTANPWNYSYRARVEISPETGGIERENVIGYYVDFTQFAETFGWERISSYDDEDYSWTWHFLAFEYWHYQKPYRNERGQIDWYQAMMEVYPAVEVAEYFNWERMISLDEDPYLIILKGVPGPIEADRWWYSLAPP